MIASWQESRDTPRQCVEKQRHHSADKGPYSQGYGLLSRHIQVWELDCKDGRAPKNWYLCTMVLEKTPESPLDSKKIKPFSQSFKKATLNIHWKDWYWSSCILVIWCGQLTHWKSLWCWERSRAEGEVGIRGRDVTGWHHWCNGHELGQTLGDGEGQGSLACCSPWSREESDPTGWLNYNNLALVPLSLFCGIIVISYIYIYYKSNNMLL